MFSYPITQRINRKLWLSPRPPGKHNKLYSSFMHDFSVSVASVAFGIYQSSQGRWRAGRHRKEKKNSTGKYTWLHNKAKWRVSFLYPLTSDFYFNFTCPFLPPPPASRSAVPFTPWASLAKQEKQNMLAVWDWTITILLSIYSCTLRVACWCSEETPFLEIWQRAPFYSLHEPDTFIK